MTPGTFTIASVELVVASYHTRQKPFLLTMKDDKIEFVENRVYFVYDKIHKPCAKQLQIRNLTNATIVVDILFPDLPEFFLSEGSKVAFCLHSSFFISNHYFKYPLLPNELHTFVPRFTPNKWGVWKDKFTFIFDNQRVEIPCRGTPSYTQFLLPPIVTFDLPDPPEVIVKHYTFEPHYNAEHRFIVDTNTLNPCIVVEPKEGVIHKENVSFTITFTPPNPLPQSLDLGSMSICGPSIAQRTTIFKLETTLPISFTSDTGEAVKHLTLLQKRPGHSLLNSTRTGSYLSPTGSGWSGSHRHRTNVSGSTGSMSMSFSFSLSSYDAEDSEQKAKEKRRHESSSSKKDRKRSKKSEKSRTSSKESSVLSAHRKHTHGQPQSSHNTRPSLFMSDLSSLFSSSYSTSRSASTSGLSSSESKSSGSTLDTSIISSFLLSSSQADEDSSLFMSSVSSIFDESSNYISSLTSSLQTNTSTPITSSVIHSRSEQTDKPASSSGLSALSLLSSAMTSQKGLSRHSSPFVPTNQRVSTGCSSMKGKRGGVHPSASSSHSSSTVQSNMTTVASTDSQSHTPSMDVTEKEGEGEEDILAVQVIPTTNPQRRSASLTSEMTLSLSEAHSHPYFSNKRRSDSESSSLLSGSISFETLKGKDRQREEWLDPTTLLMPPLASKSMDVDPSTSFVSSSTATPSTSFPFSSSFSMTDNTSDITSEAYETIPAAPKGTDSPFHITFVITTVFPNSFVNDFVDLNEADYGISFWNQIPGGKSAAINYWLHVSSLSRARKILSAYSRDKFTVFSLKFKVIQKINQEQRKMTRAGGVIKHGEVYTVADLSVLAEFRGMADQMRAYVGCICENLSKTQGLSDVSLQRPKEEKNEGTSSTSSSGSTPKFFEPAHSWRHSRAGRRRDY
ncbi:hypothetical protein BLNAU_6218 [Blattamonas nauphoetae]|uniref:Uncharacterized protein n=1 Tax=Blattamonas nauphoetae TaxID=2049346 RepID=A0ABQ9Y4T7_9EUKA|nr:hypothetical protein BLNAU_6218 [Blattamonas nauphoetae]